MSEQLLEQILIWATIIGGVAALGYLLEKFLPLRKKWRELSEARQRAHAASTLPLPLERPEGQVPLNSPFYIERPPIESDCYEEIDQPNGLIRIKAPRQMGKSSLMARVLQHNNRVLALSRCPFNKPTVARSLNLRRSCNGFA